MPVESKLMNHDSSRLEPAPALPVLHIAIAATFTAEPVKEALEFWMEEIGRKGLVEFAPYNQVFQQLLDPNSLLGRNRQGINVVLLRLEDWQRFHDSAQPEHYQAHLVAKRCRHDQCYTVCNGTIVDAANRCLLSGFTGSAGGSGDTQSMRGNRGTNCNRAGSDPQSLPDPPR